MNTSKNFFVIDNFNTVPVELLKYCGDNYILYDASIDESIPKKLEENAIRYTKIPGIIYPRILGFLLSIMIICRR